MIFFTYTILSLAFSGPGPKTGYRIVAPIYVTKEQLSVMSKFCDSSAFGVELSVVEILAETNQCLLIWAIFDQSSTTHTLPGWLSPNGNSLHPKSARFPTADKVIWRRGVPNYEIVWATGPQLRSMKRIMEKENAKGLTIQSRSKWGLHFKIGPPKVRIGKSPLLCVNDSGKVTSMPLPSVKTHLTWQETLSKK